MTQIFNDFAHIHYMNISKISQRARILLLLLADKGTTKGDNEIVDGSVKLMKQLFLLSKEIKINGFYKFVPYDLGPVSFQVYSDLNHFLKTNLIEDFLLTDTNKTAYRLTKKGMQYLSTLRSKADDKVLKQIHAIKKKYNRMELEDLIIDVYTRYPEYAKKSKIRFY